MSSVNRDEERRWMPTHVRVLVIRARGLRAKGKHGTSDAYTIIQVGKEKYSTCVMEKTTEPEWGEECSFELLPGILEQGGRDAYPPGSCDLTLTVMHRALIGLDGFLGQAVIPLDKAFQQRICMKNEWCKLQSKTGKKEKERGDLQVTVQFTRHNLTASMYDLSIKEKPRSAFIKLRERMRAKKRGGDEESSSAIVPGGYGAVTHVRGRLPSDGGGEEDYEDDEGGELRRSKMRTFFLHGRLRKSSDTRSSTSLGSESSESSSRGGSLSPTAGISVVVSDLSNSPSNSSNLTADNSPEHTVAPSPQVSPVRQVFDEPCDLSIPVPQSFTADGDAPILLPSVCVNGNPVDTSPLTHQPPVLVLQHPKLPSQTQQELTKTPTQIGSPENVKSARAQTTRVLEGKAQPSPERQPQLPKAEFKLEPRLPTLGLLQKGSALSLSLQNLPRCGEERQGSGPMEGRRWSFDKPGEEEKAAIAAALEHAGLVADEPSVENAVSVTETEVQGKKRRGLFSKGHAAGKDETGHTQTQAEGKHRGWFSSKDSYSKPSQLTTLHTDTSFSTTVSLSPLIPNDPSWGMTHQNTNPFTSPPPLSPSNPFFSLLQQNPFSQEPPAALTPPFPSLFSPLFSPSGQLSFSEETEAGKIKENADDAASQKDTTVGCTVDVSVEADEKPNVSPSLKLIGWDEFINDRLKLSEDIKQKVHPSIFKPIDLTAICIEDGLAVSYVDHDSLSPTTPPYTITGDSLNSITLFHPSESANNSISSNTDTKTEVAPEAPKTDLGLTDLSQNSFKEFSELKALMYPHGELSNCFFNNDRGNIISGTEHYLETSQPFLFSGSLSPSPLISEFSALDHKAVDLLEVSVDEGANQGLSSQMLTGDYTEESVETCAPSAPSLKDFNSEHTLEPSTIITCESIVKDLDIQVLNSSQLGLRSQDFQTDDSARTRSEAITLKEPIVKNGTKMNGPCAVHETKDQSEWLSPSVPRVMMTENDVALLDRSDNSLPEEGSITEKSEDIMTSSPGISPTPINHLSCCITDFSRGNFKAEDLSSRPLEVKSPPFSSQTLSKGWLFPFSAKKNVQIEEIPANLKAALSPGSPLIQSLYASADSEHYLTCRSQQNSFFQLSQELKPKHDAIQEAMPKNDSFQGVLPINDRSHMNMPNVHTDQDQRSTEVFQENLTRNVEGISQWDPLDQLASQIFLEEFAPSNEALVKCGMMEEAIEYTRGIEHVNGPSMNILADHGVTQDQIMLDVPTSHMIATPEEELVSLSHEPCLVENKSISNEHEKSDFASPGDKCASTDFCYFNNIDSDLVSETTSSITQDLVVTDLHLDNVFLPSCARMHTLDTNPFLIHAGATENSDRHVIRTVITSNPVKPCLDSSSHWPLTVQPVFSEPSNLDQMPLSLKHDHNLNLPFYSLDSPLAASTPQATEVTNALSPSPLPKIPSTPAYSLPNTVLLTAPLPTIQSIIGEAQAPLSQKAHEVPNLLSSPHPVKPLTPPEDKKSEGRSVLEKLKSTIHAGRGHHGEQDHEKKPLVEGGGSYYHLTRNELVSLLLQRDTELQQEREDYEHRAVLLGKREAEIKKLKVLIRDLEDYIDTLLVRIMDETPTLLQVRSKLK